jgi:hypothetical protein
MFQFPAAQTMNYLARYTPLDYEEALSLREIYMLMEQVPQEGHIPNAKQSA